jgi:phosphatidylserine/phosphatidylglycerophosphate/cardiolipin synthase-like enzyme
MDFVLPLRPRTLELVSGRGHYERVIAAVLAAERSVWIATANLKELMVEGPALVPGRGRKRGNYRSVLEVFDELAGRGVELRILHASLPSRPFRDAFDRHPRLVHGAIALRMCARVHLKTVIIDGKLIYLGSANWTGAGLGAKGEHRRNFELGVVSDDEQLLDEVQALYEQIWRGAECQGCRLRDDCEAPLCDAVAPRARGAAAIEVLSAPRAVKKATGAQASRPRARALR